MTATVDGIELYVESAGPVDAPVTILLVHGWTCSSRGWHHQMRDLPRLLGDKARVVAYDHRGHGRSAAAPRGTTRIEQLADDLVTVLEDVAPSGPVVYAGHSMGGLTLMALAEQRPDLVQERIAGAALLSTSSGQLGSRPLGLPARFDRTAAVLAPRALSVVGRRADRRARRYADGVVPPSRIQRPALRRFLFGRHCDPAEIDLFMADLAAIPGISLSGFFESIIEHDRAAALKVLSGIPVEIMHGTRDRLISPRHANRMAQLLPDARLWMYPGAGHMLMQERPRAVTQRLAGLARKAAASV
jgi:pimeloyl-ACP methyl ester carboxylesterase